jgi:hypothetical protein
MTKEKWILVTRVDTKDYKESIENGLEERTVYYGLEHSVSDLRVNLSTIARLKSLHTDRKAITRIHFKDGSYEDVLCSVKVIEDKLKPLAEIEDLRTSVV